MRILFCEFNQDHYAFLIIILTSLIHIFAGDIAYVWQGEFNDLNSIQQLFNADAFSELVKELCDE